MFSTTGRRSANNATESELSLYRHILNTEKVNADQVKDAREEARASRGFRNAVFSAMQSRPEPVFFSSPTEVLGREDSSPTAMPRSAASMSQRSQHRESPKSTWESEHRSVMQNVRLEEGREKQGALLELQKFRLRGYTLSREYDMNDSWEDINFEVDRIKHIEQTLSTVRMMGLVLEFVIQGIFYANNKWGPILKLSRENDPDTWASVQCQRIKNREFDNVLEQIYKKHWRRAQTSPEMELAMMLGGSAVMYHLESKNNERAKVPPRAAVGQPAARPPAAGGGGLLGGIMSMFGGGGGGLFGGGGGGGAAPPKPKPQPDRPQSTSAPEMKQPQSRASKFSFQPEASRGDTNIEWKFQEGGRSMVPDNTGDTQEQMHDQVRMQRMTAQLNQANVESKELKRLNAQLKRQLNQKLDVIPEEPAGSSRITVLSDAEAAGLSTADTGQTEDGNSDDHKSIVLPPRRSAPAQTRPEVQKVPTDDLTSSISINIDN